MWDKRFGGKDVDELNSFQQTSDGGYVLGGYSDSNASGDKTQNTWGPGEDYWIVKTDSVGIKVWDNDFGGFGVNMFHSMEQTSDGGYILGGWSNSGIGGDKSQNTVGGYDYWIIKLDSLGNKKWDKDFGGTLAENLYSIHQTTDNGYILGGCSKSNAGGDKSEDNRDTSTYTYDYWIVKTDSLGNKIWDKRFGGTNDDLLYSIQQTSDGGYIFGGYSASGAGGDKTQNTWSGTSDYWIVKTDSLGNKQWDKDFGGTNSDFFSSLKQTSDGGYILGGTSASSASGDKSQNVVGIEDYWIIKIDSSGNKQWDKDFGGSFEEDRFGYILQTFDGGYLLSGISRSDISGDKTENNLGWKQAWIVKTDSSGIKQWDKTAFTAPDDKIPAYAIQSFDGCFLIAKPCYGTIAGYKTQENWDTTYSTSDYWLIKFCDSTLMPSTATAITDSLLCSGTCIDFTNLSLNATSYQWSFFGASPDTSTAINPTNICYPNSGTYDIQLIAFNANGSDTLLLTDYITVYPQPASQSITQSNDTLVAIAGASSYQWYYNTIIINGATGYVYVATLNGDYNVVATDSNGCEVEAAIFNVITTVTTLSLANDLLLLPNPTSSKLTIISSVKIAELKIFDTIGKELFTETVLENKVEMDIRFLSSGIYFLHIQTEKGNVVKRFIKE
jgi:hypothetical protein